MDEEISKNVLKTGTVTLGIICKDGIVLAADNRISYGAGSGVAYIAGKTKKILEINDRLVVTMAGTASDAKRVVEILKAELRLKELKTKERETVKEVANLIANMQFSNIRQFSSIPSIAQFILAGYDDEGTHLYNIMPDGYLEDVDKYTASGAGIVQVHPILDSEYKPNLSISEGLELAMKCIKAAMKREPSVGDGLNIYVIKKGEIKEVSAKDVSIEFKDK